MGCFQYVGWHNDDGENNEVDIKSIKELLPYEFTIIW